MPKVGNKQFSYTERGRAAAVRESKRTGKGGKNTMKDGGKGGKKGGKGAPKR